MFFQCIIIEPSCPWRISLAGSSLANGVDVVVKNYKKEARCLYAVQDFSLKKLAERFHASVKAEYPKQQHGVRESRLIFQNSDRWQTYWKTVVSYEGTCWRHDSRLKLICAMLIPACLYYYDTDLQPARPG